MLCFAGVQLLSNFKVISRSLQGQTVKQHDFLDLLSIPNLFGVQVSIIMASRGGHRSMASRGGHKSHIFRVPELRLRVPETRLRVPEPRFHVPEPRLNVAKFGYV